MRARGDYFVAENAIVLGDVRIGCGANIWYNCVIRGDLATVTLEQNVNLQDQTVIHTDRDAPMLLERGVVVGHRVILHGARVGRDTLIGMGAILLSGSDIGEESLVAAGTVIPAGRRIPPRSVVMGVPGRIVREIRDDEVAETRRICEHYLQLARRHAQGEFCPPWER